MYSNDLVSIGADIVVYGDIISSGNSGWFTEETKALLEGLKKASDDLAMAIPCGKTPTLKDNVKECTLDLAGASVGIIKPKTRLIYGQTLRPGNRIFGLESSGVHSNGITLIKKNS